MKKILIFITAAVLAILALNLVRTEDAPAPASAQQQNCQYEGRLYPDGSCNNSDPCDPGTLKDPILQGDCAPEVKESSLPKIEENGAVGAAPYHESQSEIIGGK